MSEPILVPLFRDSLKSIISEMQSKLAEYGSAIHPEHGLIGDLLEAESLVDSLVGIWEDSDPANFLTLTDILPAGFLDLLAEGEEK